MRYWSKARVMEDLVYPVIDRQFADDYDPQKLIAAFDPLIEWKVDRDEQGNDLLNTEGFEPVWTDEQFWDALASAEIATDDEDER